MKELQDEPVFQVSDIEKYEKWEEFCLRRDKIFWIECAVWALLMENEIEKGKTVAQVANSTVQLTNLPMMPHGSWAIKILYQCWVHGRELITIPSYAHLCS